MSRKHTVRIVLTLIIIAAALPGLAGLAHGATNAVIKAVKKPAPIRWIALVVTPTQRWSPPSACLWTTRPR